MNHLYQSIGTTRQNVHQRLNRMLQGMELEQQLIPLMQQVRENHPEMGAAELYRKMGDIPMGRDRFRQFYNDCGYKLKRKINPRRTTDSFGVSRFDNLLLGRELTGINQVWVSDITYYELEGRFSYLTFIMDLYSRKIVGYSASKTLHTLNTTIPALKMALVKRSPLPAGTIFHSDGGGQYYCKDFIRLTKRALILNSMGVTAYENPHAERLNGTIKNAYLRGYGPDNFKELQHQLKKAVTMYNTEKPHQALNGITPLQFEINLKQKHTIFNHLFPKSNSKKVNSI